MTHRSFPDHFSALAGAYAAFRPRYPATLFTCLAGLAPARELAWDCGAGSGQATLDLAHHFARVVATDASAEQLARAPAHPRVTCRVALAEASGLDAASVDLVTVAQALHWFALPAFYAEVARVLRPAGLIAVWSYGVPELAEPALRELVHDFAHVTVGPYWPAERAAVDSGYRTLPFPFEELAPPAFELTAAWTLAELTGYVRTWSAVRRYREAQEADPVTALAAALAPLWGDAEARRAIGWPLALRIGRLRNG